MELVKSLWKYVLVALLAGVSTFLATLKQQVIDSLPQLEERVQKEAHLAWEGLKGENLEDDEPIYICGRNEAMQEQRFAPRPWPNRTIKWTVKFNGFTGLANDKVLEAFRVAWMGWSADIDIDPQWVDKPSDAHVLIQFGDIDGSGKVLAWSELSDGTSTQKEQLYDRKEQWEIAEVTRRIDLVRVAAHEIGHVLGLKHDSTNSNALMAPMYSRSVRLPTNRDISRAIALGYRPKQKAPLPKQGGGGVSLKVTVEESELIEAVKSLGFSVTK